MARIDAQLKIRLPADLKDKIEKEAGELMRSMNAEIVARLEASFEPTLLYPEDDSELEGFFQQYVNAMNSVVQREIDAIEEAAREVGVLDDIADQSSRLKIRFIKFKRQQDTVRSSLDMLLFRIENLRRTLDKAADEAELAQSAQ